MGPRTSQTETQRDQEASQGIPEGPRSKATTGSVRNEACPPNHGDHTQVKRHRAPAQQEQEQVTTTRCHAQTHQEPLPGTVVPSFTSAPQSQPVPPPRRSPPKSSHERRSPARDTKTRRSPPRSSRPNRSPPRTTPFTVSSQPNQYAKAYTTTAQDRSHNR